MAKDKITIRISHLEQDLLQALDEIDEWDDEEINEMIKLQLGKEDDQNNALSASQAIKEQINEINNKEGLGEEERAGQIGPLEEELNTTRAQTKIGLEISFQEQKKEDIEEQIGSSDDPTELETRLLEITHKIETLEQELQTQIDNEWITIGSNEDAKAHFSKDGYLDDRFWSTVDILKIRNVKQHEDKETFSEKKVAALLYPEAFFEFVP